jgi:hypothetical protein
LQARTLNALIPLEKAAAIKPDAKHTRLPKAKGSKEDGVRVLHFFGTSRRRQDRTADFHGAARCCARPELFRTVGRVEPPGRGEYFDGLDGETQRAGTQSVNIMHETPDYLVPEVLRDDTPILIRAIGPDDKQLLVRHFQG